MNRHQELCSSSPKGFVYLGIKVLFEKVDHIRIVETKATCFVLHTATTNEIRNPKYILIEKNTVVYIVV